jgi:hypothetical protein
LPIANCQLLSKEPIEFREQRDESIRVRSPIELTHSLRAHAAAGRKIVGRDCLAHARKKDKLEPLRESHGVHGECLRELQLLRPKRLFLPESNPPHLSLNLIGVLRSFLLAQRQ